MKNKYIFILGGAIIALSFTKISTESEISKFASTKSHLFSSGPPTGKTGAPGESNCTDCHSGTVQSGTGINQVMLINSSQQIVSEYTPGETYSVTVTTETAAKKGFQISARILSDNSKAGSSTGIATNTEMKSANNQEYIGHVSASNTSQSGWTFNWTAPATNVGDVRFYLAANTTNNSSTSAGDVIRISQHTFPVVSGASIVENDDFKNLEIAYKGINNSLSFNFNLQENNAVYMNLVDLSGKSILSKRFSDLNIGKNHQDVFLSKDLKDGIYIVHFFVDNKSTSKKIFINK